MSASQRRNQLLLFFPLFFFPKKKDYLQKGEKQCREKTHIYYVVQVISGLGWFLNGIQCMFHQGRVYDGKVNEVDLWFHRCKR